jgi:hypothetical protein
MRLHREYPKRAQRKPMYLPPTSLREDWRQVDQQQLVIHPVTKCQVWIMPTRTK